MIDRNLRVRALDARASSPKLLLGLRGPMTVDGAREVLEVRSRSRAFLGPQPPLERGGCPRVLHAAAWAASSLIGALSDWFGPASFFFE